jgi:nucleoside-diphosphate-sugar epimerase
MDSLIPSIIVTGASGVVGRNFIGSAKGKFLIYAVARRSQVEAGVPYHPNIKWVRVDIADFNTLKTRVLDNLYCIKPGKPAVDFVLHLASYYDYNYTPNVEYERTNVRGTYHMLELSKMLNVRRFVFSSSVAAVKFPPKGKRVTEIYPASASHPYADSKRKGENLVKEYSRYFPCSVVRSAAVFTDWCEYTLLYHFLERWLSCKWGRRVLCGKGECAIPFIHARDLNNLLLILFRESDRLPVFDVYIAGPDGSTSNRELFYSATTLYFGQEVKPQLLPLWLAVPLVVIRDILMRLCGKRPFERPWMLKYVDRKLEIDSSYTRSVLSWEPDPQLHILRRMNFIIENFKNRPDEMARANL